MGNLVYLYNLISKYKNLKLNTIPNKWNNCYGDIPSSTKEIFNYYLYNNLKQTKLIYYTDNGIKYKFYIYPKHEMSKALFVTRTYEPETLFFFEK